MVTLTAERPSPGEKPVGIVHERRHLTVSASKMFSTLFYDRQADCYWLDSSRVIEGMSRFSILGKAAGPRAETVLVNCREKLLRIRSRSGSEDAEWPGGLSWLHDRLARWKIVDTPALAIPFVGGYVGYIGYEAKATTCSHHGFSSPTWDIGLIFADRFVVLDHKEKLLYVVAVAEQHDFDSAEGWVLDTLEQIESLKKKTLPQCPKEEPVAKVRFTMRHDKAAYLARIEAALEAIEAGESYEICLTNQIATTDLRCDPLNVYLQLRERNPAPYAAFLQIDGISIACSSPERFLMCDRHGSVETKPIKGTAARSPDSEEDRERARTLEEDDKARSENLMITDLLRNDLSRVCEVGSVHVPSLMQVETYETVHQLVTTVRGQLAANRTALDCVTAMFPGGSMTGAPKLRTLDIIDALEAGPRGIYSGVLGWLGIDGAADLNIIIRTIVMDGDLATIGVGGAIIAMSNPEDEFAEMLLKARPALAAISAAMTGTPDRYVLEGETGGQHLHIRAPRVDDIPKILGGLLALFAEHGPDDRRVDADTEALLSSVVARESANRLLVASGRDGTLEGFIGWSYSMALSAGGSYATIGELWVRPSARSKGVGNRLLDAAIARCGAAGVKTVEICIPPRTNTEDVETARLCARNGFLAAGQYMRRFASSGAEARAWAHSARELGNRVVGSSAQRQAIDSTLGG